jgi:hypothetical protein
VTLKRWDNDRQPEDITQHVLAVDTHKTYGNPVGQFSVTIPYTAKVNGYRYDQFVKPFDIISIDLDGGYGAGLVPVMVGLVDEPKRIKQLQQPDGQPQRFVQLMCSDFGRILAQHHVQWYLAISPGHIGDPQALTQAVYGARLLAGGTPAKIATAIVDGEVWQQMPWTKEYITSERITTPDDWYRVNITLSYQETVWQSLLSISNEPFNKLSADTLENGKFGIILEKCPFDDFGRLDLPYPRTLHMVGDSEIVTEELGTNDYDRLTYLYQYVDCGIFSEPSGQNLLYLMGDAVQPDAKTGADLVAQYGFQPYLPKSQFVPFPPPGAGRQVPPHLANYPVDDSLLRPVQARTKLFWNWFKNNAAYESGLVTLHGRPDIRCGDGLVNKDTNYQYFVEQVAHRWMLGEQILCWTTLHLTRGQPNA